MVRTTSEKEEFIKFTAEAQKVKPGFTREFADIVGAAEKAVPVRRGGGGRRISPGIDIAAQQEATRLREEAEQQRIQDQITQQEIRAEQQQARQEKIFSGTIAGQIKGRETSIGLPGTSFEQAIALGRAEERPSPKFDFGFFRKKVVAPIFLAGEQGETIFTSFRNIGSLFRSKDKGAEFEFKSPEFGTISDQPLPFGAGGGETTTGIQLQREEAIADPSLLIPSEARATQVSEEISKDLISELQPKVTSGELTIPEAEKQFETKFEKQFQQKLPDIQKSAEFRGRFERGQEPTFKGETLAEIGGIGALSLTPFGQVASGVSFAAIGLPKLFGGETKTEKALGLVEIGLGARFGSLGVIKAGRIATQGEIAGAIEEASLSQKGFTFKVGEDIFDVTRGRASGAAFADIQEVKVSRLIDSNIVISKGQRVTSIIGQDIFSGKQFGKIITENIAARTSLLPSKVSGFTFGIGEGATIKTSELSIFQKKGGLKSELNLFGFDPSRIKREPLIGFGKKFDDFTIGGGGRVKRVSLETIKGGRFGSEFEVIEGVSIGFPLESRVVLKELKVPSTEEGINIFRGRGKPTDFFPKGNGKTKQIIKTDLPSISFAPPKLDLPTSKQGLGFGLPRAVGGEGLTESQLQISRGGLSQFAPPSGKQGVFVREDQLLSSNLFSGISQVSFGRQETKQLGLSLQIPKTSLAQRQVSKQLSKQLQIQKQLTQQEFFAPRTPPTQRGFDSFADFSFGFPFFPFPKLLGGGVVRGRKKKRAKAKVPIRPSFTGIILGIEEAPIISPILGVVPGQIRGLETGFDVPKKKKKKKAKKSKKK